MRLDKKIISFALILTAILLTVSLVIDPLLGIFIVSLITCIAMEDKEENEKTTK